MKLRHAMFHVTLCVVVLLSASASKTRGQSLFTYEGDTIPAEIEAMYVRGLAYLQKTQTGGGGWPEQYGSDPGVVGLCVLAILAHGEDPNFGPYRDTIRKGLNHILNSANTTTGYIGSSMYNHGFATLALAEAYGAVDGARIGPALEKAVSLIVTSQESNAMGAWRYSPTSQDADTTVSGAQMVALIAARNAGISVPNSAIKKGLNFYRRCQSGDGGFGYTNAGGSSPPRTAIGALVFSLAGKTDTPQFKSAFRNLEQAGFNGGGYLHYYIYYASQAYFRADMKAWTRWNSSNLRVLSNSQRADGGWYGSRGPAFSTSTALLSLALNYRFLPIYER